MTRVGTTRLGKTLILAGILSLSLTGCEYWPPALLAQLGQPFHRFNQIWDQFEPSLQLVLDLRPLAFDALI